MPIKNRMILFIILIMLVPTIILLIISSMVLKNHIDICAQNCLYNSSGLTTNLMKAHLKEMQKYGQLIIADKELKEAIKYKKSFRLEKVLEKYSENCEYLDLIFVFDKYRNCILSNSGTKEVDLSDIKHIFTDVQKLQKSVVSEEILHLDKLFIKDSDYYRKYLVRVNKTGEEKIFTKCHVGLVIMPISEKDDFLGFLVMGDITNNDSYFPKMHSETIKDSYLSIFIEDIRVTTNVKSNQKINFIDKSIPINTDKLKGAKNKYFYSKAFVDKEKFVVLDIPITNYAKMTIGTLRVALPEQKFIALMNASQKTIFIVNLFCLLLVIFIGNYFAQHISTPIQKATEFAKKISQGETDLEITKELFNSNEETATLLKTLKNLANDLERSKKRNTSCFKRLKIQHLKQELLTKRLQKLNNELEEKVVERTNHLNETLQALQNANEVKTSFLANMTHELRTPLSSIIASSSLLKDEFFGSLNVKQHKYLEMIIMNANHLLQLINDILDISKIHAGKMGLTPEDYSVRDLVEESYLSVKSLAYNKNIAIEIKFEPKDFRVKVDAIRFKQILYNILSNAVKFTPDNGEVFTKVFKKNDNLYVTVKDTGIGIKKEDLKIIFNEFEQIDNSYERYYEGTGLGLPLVKKFVEMHGGKVCVKSKLGEGTEVSFNIPKAF